MNWYTIRTQNNKEKKVSERLKLFMKKEYDSELSVLIPTHVSVSIKKNKKDIKDKLLYPGYIFVGTNNIENLTQLVKITDGATNILKDGSGNPIIMKEEDINRIKSEMDTQKQIINSPYIKGEKINIINGPFSTFNGEIQIVDNEKSRLRVEILIFGRSTLVDVDFNDVNKIID